MTQEDSEQGSENPFDRKLAILAEEFQSKLRTGAPVSIEEYCEQFPELSLQIRQTFPAIEALEEVAVVERTSDHRDQDGPNETPILKADPSHAYQKIGPYEIEEIIGRGGMGIVYKAVQPRLHRVVALKVLPLALAQDADLVERFKTEATAVARTSHPSIVPIHEVGMGLAITKDGKQSQLHYFAMQFINGLSLDRLIRLELESSKESNPAIDQSARMIDREGDQNSSQNQELDESTKQTARYSSTRRRRNSRTGNDSPLDCHDPKNPTALVPDIDIAMTNRERWMVIANVGIKVADALSHAHSQNILHRDIKPSNLIVGENGNVWVADFGLAKLVDAESTATNSLVGTLRFMPPERFQGWSDPRSDIYSLGMTLFELAILGSVFPQTDRSVIIENIIQGKYSLPRHSVSSIPSDLETIVLKAIDREPANRYQSALELKQDLKRFVASEPIRASRPSTLKVIKQWAKRNPVTARVTALLALSILVIAVLGVVFSNLLFAQNRTLLANKEKLEDQRDEQMKLLELSQKNAADAHLRLAQLKSESGRIGQRIDAQLAIRDSNRLFRACKSLAEQTDWIYDLRNTMIRSSLHFDMRQMVEANRPPHQTLLPIPGAKKIIVRNDQGGRSDLAFLTCETIPRLGLNGIQIEKSNVIWRLKDLEGLADVVSSRQGKWIGIKHKSSKPESRQEVITIVDSRSGTTVAEEEARAVSFSPDDSQIAFLQKSQAGATEVVFLEPQTLKKWRPGIQPMKPCDGLVFLDEDTICFWGYQLELELVSIKTGKRSSIWLGDTTRTVQASSSGTILALGSYGGDVYLLDTRKRKLVQRLPGHRSRIHSLSFSNDGRALAVASDSTVRFWEVHSGRLLLEDARVFATVQMDALGESIFIQTPRSYYFYEAFPNDAYRVRSLDFQPSGRIQINPSGDLLALSNGAFVNLFDGVTLDPLCVVASDQAATYGFDPSGNLVTVLDGFLTSWTIHEASDGRLEIGPPERISDTKVGIRFDQSDDGHLIAAVRNNEILLLNRNSGEADRIGVAHKFDSIALQPDGNFVAAVGKKVSVFRVNDKKLLLETSREDSSVNQSLPPEAGRVEFSAMQTLKFRTPDGTTKVFDLNNGRHHVIQEEEKLTLSSLSGKLELNLVEQRLLLRTATPKPLNVAEIPFHRTRRPSHICLRFDLGRIYAVTDNFELHCWDLARINQLLKTENLSWPESPVESTLNRSTTKQFHLTTDGKIRFNGFILGSPTKPIPAKALQR